MIQQKQADDRHAKWVINVMYWVGLYDLGTREDSGVLGCGEGCRGISILCSIFPHYAISSSLVREQNSNTLRRGPIANSNVSSEGVSSGRRRCSKCIIFP